MLEEDVIEPHPVEIAEEPEAVNLITELGSVSGMAAPHSVQVITEVVVDEPVLVALATEPRSISTAKA